MKLIIVRDKYKSKQVVNILTLDQFQRNSGRTWNGFITSGFQSDYTFQLVDINLNLSYYVAFKVLYHLN